MPAVRPLRPAPEWDTRFTRMCGVSALAHGVAIAAVMALSARSGWKPLPLVAYTVEITDPRALGGRLPPGAPGRDLKGGPTSAPAPEPKAEPAPAPPVAAKPLAPEPVARVEEPAVKVPEAPKPPEPKPVAKPPEPKVAEPKPLAKPPEPKPEPQPETKKPEPPRPEPVAKAEPKPVAGHEAASEKPTGAANGTATADTQPAADAYTAAAERWRARTGGQEGGGLGGTATASGPVGAGGEGKGGGGQLVGLEFLAYRQQVITTIKARWTNVIVRPGLMAAVRFEIAPDGAVSDVKLEQSSGNPAYDGSALRAVQQANPLPAPPARYVKEFREFVVEFHSEEHGGQEAG